MVSCVLSWEGISKPVIVDTQKTKVNSEYYTNHLKNDLLPVMNQFYPHNDGIFAQDGASSHMSSLCQKFISKEFGKGQMITKRQWPPHLNPLNYYFWAEVQTKVFKGRREPFKELKEFKTQIQTVWEAASNQDKLHNSFQGPWLL